MFLVQSSLRWTDHHATMVVLSEFIQAGRQRCCGSARRLRGPGVHQSLLNTSLNAWSLRWCYCGSARRLGGCWSWCRRLRRRTWPPPTPQLPQRSPRPSRHAHLKILLSGGRLSGMPSVANLNSALWAEEETLNRKSWRPSAPATQCDIATGARVGGAGQGVSGRRGARQALRAAVRAGARTRGRARGAQPQRSRQDKGLDRRVCIPCLCRIGLCARVLAICTRGA